MDGYETITAYFVTTGDGSDDDGRQNLSKALKCLKEYLPADRIHEINDKDGVYFILSKELTKTDVLVFDRFRGELFKLAQQKKCLIIGALCLLECIKNSLPIPNGCSPIYNVAMRDLQISISGISSQEKDKLCQLIQWMGGMYYPHFSRSATHLVSNTIKSAKYEHAASSGIPVMHVDWVQRVWERSLNCTVYANDSEFDKYKLPIFFGTNITCTGIDSGKKDEIKRLVNENGGIYHPAFKSQIIDIVITEKEKTNTDKFQAAVSYKKDILLTEWIFDSVEKGYALPTSNYKVQLLKISTPTKADQAPADFICSDNTHGPELSQISSVGRKQFKKGSTTLDETNYSNVNDSVPPTLTKMTKSKNNYQSVLSAICPQMAKNAGNFLDGCDIYLSGFRIDEREKLNRILNAGGATRYDVINEKLTHIIVGDTDSIESKNWKNNNITAHIVRLDWLLESIRFKQPVNELKHQLSLSDFLQPGAPSPSSKKILRSMNCSFKQPSKLIRKQLFETGNNVTNENLNIQENLSFASTTKLPLDNEEENLTSQYVQRNKDTLLVNRTNEEECIDLPAVPLACSTQIGVKIPTKENPDTFSTFSRNNLQNFFQGMSIYIEKTHFSDEFYSDILSECNEAGGLIVGANFQDPVDYAVVSFEHTFDISTLPIKAKHIVTELYVENCLTENKLMPIEYYHKHIPNVADKRPLENMTIVISIYTSFERDFLNSLAQLLGATVNKSYVRGERPLLVCASPEGAKYTGAIKWNYPVVTSQWLLACVNEGRKVNFGPYLVGESSENFPKCSTSINSSTQHQQEMQMETNNNEDIQNNGPLLTNNNKNNNNNNLGNTFTPLRSKRVSELASSSLYNFTSNISPQTPENNSNYSSYNFEFMEKILEEIENLDERETLREVIMEMKMNPTPELERIRRQACTPINRKIPTPKGIPEFCTTPEFQKRMADDFERRWRLPSRKMKPDTPIEVIRKRILKATCKAMGVTYNLDDDTIDKDDTLKNKQFNMEVRNKSPVSTRNEIISDKINENANRCEKSTSLLEHTKEKMDHLLVPNTQSPQVSQVNSLNGEVKNQRAVVERSTINFDYINFDDSFGNSGSDKNPEISARNCSVEIQQITDYLKNCEKKRQSLKRLHENQDINESSGNISLLTTNNISSKKPLLIFESEKIGNDGMVEWHDPFDLATGDKNQNFNKSTESNLGKTPRFSISCADEKTRKEIIIKILHLGGEVCENLQNFDSSCTHIVCERPNRGEKILGCISSGKWVLGLKYIDESFANEKFVDEELYEWGNYKAVNLPQLSADENIIAQAAHRWRQKISQDNEVLKGAFSGISAILHLSGRNKDALKNVIIAGGGVVIEAVPPFSINSRTKEATHCFVDIKKCSLNRADYQFLKQNRILILSQMYLNAYLMKGDSVDVEKYELQM